MNMLHLDDTRLDDLQPIREEHFNCIKSKKIGDFVREYVTNLMPQFYQRLVSIPYNRQKGLLDPCVIITVLKIVSHKFVNFRSKNVCI